MESLAQFYPFVLRWFLIRSYGGRNFEVPPSLESAAGDIRREAVGFALDSMNSELRRDIEACRFPSQYDVDEKFHPTRLETTG
jgi:hypothetical protein